MSNTNYYVATGEADKERLEIINEVYNPVTQSFILESGLKSGDNVLEIGCGYGQMSIWLAKQVSPKGIVYAVDYSNDSLEIARSNAKRDGINNIKFIHLDINELNSLDMKFDFMFGRWVLEFCSPVSKHIKNIYNQLTSGGIFVYEALNLDNSGHFSVPHNKIIDIWRSIILKNSKAHNSELSLADNIYYMMRDSGFVNMFARKHQPILTSAREKSLYRRVIVNSKDRLLEHNIITEEDYELIIRDMAQFERDDSISGFFNNTLIRGYKS